MSEASMDFSGSTTFASLNDGHSTVTSQYSPTEGLAPKGGTLSSDNAVVVIAPGITDPYFTWNFVRRGVTLDKKSLIATFELPSSGLFLSYDFATKSVVIKNDSQPAWIVTQYSGGQTQFQITPLTSPTTYLTYAGQAQVTVDVELTATSDIPKQVWNISQYVSAEDRVEDAAISSDLWRVTQGQDR